MSATIESIVSESVHDSGCSSCGEESGSDKLPGLGYIRASLQRWFKFIGLIKIQGLRGYSREAFSQKRRPVVAHSAVPRAAKPVAVKMADV